MKLEIKEEKSRYSMIASKIANRIMQKICLQSSSVACLKILKLFELCEKGYDSLDYQMTAVDVKI